MIRTKVEKKSRSIGEIRRRKIWIRGRWASNLLSSKAVLIHINKVSQLGVDLR
jgi:hypothetical protein